MKISIRHIPLSLAILCVTALLAGCQPEGPTFQVNDVVSDPGAFNKTLSVVGVVNAYGKTDSSLVGIMDKKELQCTTPGCSKVLLAVRVKGDRPAIGDEVKATGSFTKESWGYVLNAEKVSVLANHDLGGK